MQHAGLSPERWAAFSLDRQVLMIANEMNRAAKLFDAADRQRLIDAYERVLRLVDLTVEVQPRRNLRRELLRWRELLAELYVAPEPARHRALFRCLLQLTPASAEQIQYVLPP